MPIETLQDFSPCGRCNARGKVDSRDGKSWREISVLPPDHPDTRAVMAGQITPVMCPDCGGTGIVKNNPTQEPTQ